MSQTQTKTKETAKEELIIFFKTHNVQVIEEQDTIKVLGNVVYVSTDFVIVCLYPRLQNQTHYIR